MSEQAPEKVVIHFQTDEMWTACEPEDCAGDLPHEHVGYIRADLLPKDWEAFLRDLRALLKAARAWPGAQCYAGKVAAHLPECPPTVEISSQAMPETKPPEEP